uniref:Uncharacterized protein n=1 Tax=Plectus sambesii TaxID=2011161 RepID=A0A914W4L3_9BILA
MLVVVDASNRVVRVNSTPRWLLAVACEPLAVEHADVDVRLKRVCLRFEPLRLAASTEIARPLSLTLAIARRLSGRQAESTIDSAWWRRRSGDATCQQH